MGTTRLHREFKHADGRRVTAVAFTASGTATLSSTSQEMVQAAPAPVQAVIEQEDKEAQL